MGYVSKREKEHCPLRIYVNKSVVMNWITFWSQKKDTQYSVFKSKTALSCYFLFSLHYEYLLKAFVSNPSHNILRWFHLSHFLKLDIVSWQFHVHVNWEVIENTIKINGRHCYYHCYYHYYYTAVFGYNLIFSIALWGRKDSIIIKNL